MECINYPAWIQALAAIAIVIITGFYTHYAKQQAERMREAVKTAKDTAEAAKKSADALPEIERAYVFVTVEYEQSKRVVGINFFDFGDSLFIENHGRTPAIIKKVRGLVCLREASIPEIRESEIPAGLLIGSDKWKRIPAAPQKINEREREDILLKNITAYCCGRIEYEDVFSEAHTTGFCWEYRQMADSAYWIVSDRYKELNYRT